MDWGWHASTVLLTEVRSTPLAAVSTNSYLPIHLVFSSAITGPLIMMQIFLSSA